MAIIRRALYKIPLIGGIEKVPAIVLGISLAIIVLYAPLYGKLAGSIIILVLWGILAKLNSDDPIFLSVLVNYVSQQKFYHAQAMETKKKNKLKTRFNP